MLGNFSFFLSSADIFQHFSEYSFGSGIMVSNSLDPDQAGHSVGPDLGSNCLHRSPEEVKIHC